MRAGLFDTIVHAASGAAAAAHRRIDTVMQLVIASESLGKERGGPTWRRHYGAACAVYDSPIVLGKDLAQVRLLLLLAPQPLACLLLLLALLACYISQSHKLCKSPMKNRIRGTLLDDLNFLDALAEKLGKMIIAISHLPDDVRLPARKPPPKNADLIFRIEMFPRGLVDLCPIALLATYAMLLLLSSPGSPAYSQASSFFVRYVPTHRTPIHM